MEPFEVWILRTMMMMGDDDDSYSDNSKNYCFASTYYLAGTLQVTYFLSFSFLMCKVKKTAFNPTVRL